jgi:hypothetical protein
MVLQNPRQYLHSQGYSDVMIAFEMKSNECTIEQLASDVFASQEAFVEAGYSRRNTRLLTYSF